MKSFSSRYLCGGLIRRVSIFREARDPVGWILKLQYWQRRNMIRKIDLNFLIKWVIFIIIHVSFSLSTREAINNIQRIIIFQIIIIKPWLINMHIWYLKMLLLHRLWRGIQYLKTRFILQNITRINTFIYTDTVIHIITFVINRCLPTLHNKVNFWVDRSVLFRLRAGVMLCSFIVKPINLIFILIMPFINGR